MHLFALSFLFLCSSSGVLAGSNILANKYFLEKQKFLFEVLLRLEEPLLKQEWMRSGSQPILDAAEYVEINAPITEFYTNYKSGRLLPKGAPFSALQPQHAQQAWGLYNLLYNSRDWDTLAVNICWARQHVNEGVFLHALTQALLKRGDLKGLILPKISELLPQHFLTSKFVHAAESFDYANWQHAKQLYKEAQLKQPAKSRACQHCWPWQWWRFKRLDAAIYEDEEKFLLPRNLSNLRNTTQWQRAMQGLKLLWMPADYTRDQRPKAEEHKLSYFTEDIGWNSYWYYLNMGLSWNSEASLKPAWRALWFWNLQQLIARYKIERFGRGLSELTSSNDYEPLLMSWSGDKFRAASMKDDTVMLTLDKLLQRTRLAITEQRYELKSRQSVAFDSVAHLNLIMDDMFDDLYSQFGKFLEELPQPTLLHNYETMLREPAFYRYAEKLLEIYWLLRSTMLSYGSEKLTLSGLKIEEIRLSSLVTHFELVDADVSSLLSNKMFYYEGQLLREKALMARQQRLTHKPFRLFFNITAEWPQNVILRTFLGLRQQPSEIFNWQSFYQLDTFVTSIPAGNNVIQRRSVDFTGAIKDHPTQTELYQLAKLALDNDYDFPLNISTPHCGFPQRLQLPQGWAAGLPLQLFTIVTPYNFIASEAHNNLDCDFTNGIESFDEMPYGFPFDRPIERADLLVPNVFMLPVKIFHEDRRLKRFK